MFFLFLLAPTGPFPIYGFHFPLLLCPSAWFLVSSYNESRGFYLFFPPPMALPLSQIPHLHQLPSNPVSLSPSLCFPSLFRFIVFTRFASPPSMPYSTPSPPLTILSHFYFSHWHAIPLFFLSRALFFSLVPLKPSPFHFAFPQQMHSSQTRIRALTSPPKHTSAAYHTFVTVEALCHFSSALSTTISWDNALLQCWQKMHLQEITQPINYSES